MNKIIAQFKTLPQSTKIIIMILSVTIIWLLSGFLKKRVNDDQININNNLISVIVKHSKAQQKTLFLSVYGTTKIDNNITINSEINGRVISIDKHKGENVNQGDIIISLASPEYINILEAASTNLANKSNLLEQIKKNQASTSFQTLLKEVEIAKIEYEKAKRYSKNKVVRASFSGKIDKIYITEGENIKIGDKLFSIFQPLPVLASGHIPQKYINMIDMNKLAKVNINDTTKLNGKIKFVSQLADSNTRSFETEIEIIDPPLNIQDGLTTEIMLPIKTVKAHAINRSTLSIDDNGNVGIKYVDKNQIVHFKSIEILDDEEQKLYVYGIDDELDIITQGHGFINAGQKVNIVRDNG